jgi:hypothetical protein
MNKDIALQMALTENNSARALFYKRLHAAMVAAEAKVRSERR